MLFPQPTEFTELSGQEQVKAAFENHNLKNIITNILPPNFLNCISKKKFVAIEDFTVCICEPSQRYDGDSGTAEHYANSGKSLKQSEAVNQRGDRNDADSSRFDLIGVRRGFYYIYFPFYLKENSTQFA